MYHGQQVPGFPSHPHRGFETVTIVRQGLTDHSDSLGAAARFGGGDVQWLTAGKGIVHSEMFPLLDTDQPNPLELFQIWLNLPARSKMADPHFTMLWAEDIPHRFFESGDGARHRGRGHRRPARRAPGGRAAGAAARLVGVAGPRPTSRSGRCAWSPGARWKLPPSASADARRKLYFFAGVGVDVAGETLTQHAAIELRAASAVELVNTGADAVEFLMLQGRPIGEPVAQYGPFVMNTEAELRQAFDDYRRTEFGGWPWPDTGPVHGPERVRFARHADGRVETLALSADDRSTMANVTPPDVAAADDGETVASSVVLNENASRGMQ